MSLSTFTVSGMASRPRGLPPPGGCARGEHVHTRNRSVVASQHEIDRDIASPFYKPEAQAKNHFMLRFPSLALQACRRPFGIVRYKTARQEPRPPHGIEADHAASPRISPTNAAIATQTAMPTPARAMTAAY